MNGFLTSMVTVLTAIIGLAIVATLVSPNARTADVSNSFWGGFSGALQSATGPVTGQQPTVSFGGGGLNLASLGGTFLSNSLSNI